MCHHCNEDGVVALSVPDGRRGVWMRVTKEAIELFAGREGGDEYLKLQLGEVVTAKHIRDAFGILCSYAWALELASSLAYSEIPLTKDEVVIKRKLIELEEKAELQQLDEKLAKRDAEAE